MGIGKFEIISQLCKLWGTTFYGTSSMIMITYSRRLKDFEAFDQVADLHPLYILDEGLNIIYDMRCCSPITFKVMYEVNQRRTWFADLIHFDVSRPSVIQLSVLWLIPMITNSNVHLY